MLVNDASSTYCNTTYVTILWWILPSLIFQRYGGVNGDKGVETQTPVTKLVLGGRNIDETSVDTSAQYHWKFILVIDILQKIVPKQKHTWDFNFKKIPISNSNSKIVTEKRNYLIHISDNFLYINIKISVKLWLILLLRTIKLKILYPEIKN